jgi:hypothetical protein
VWRIRDKAIPEAVTRGTIGSGLDKLSKGLAVTRKVMGSKVRRFFALQQGLSKTTEAAPSRFILFLYVNLFDIKFF